MCDCKYSFSKITKDGRRIVKCKIKSIDDSEKYSEMKDFFEGKYPGHNFVPNDECQFYYNEGGQSICPCYESKIKNKNMQKNSKQK